MTRKSAIQNRVWILAAIAALASLGCAADKSGQTETSTNRRDSASQITCTKSDATHQCHYLVYSKTCAADLPQGDKPSLTCKYEVLDSFTLKEGETKELLNYPQGYKECMDPNKKPELRTCVETPAGQ